MLGEQDLMKWEKKYLNRVYLCKGKTTAALQIFTTLIPSPVIARYSFGADTL